MASQPYITYDHLSGFYEKYKRKDLKDEFFVVDLNGRQINHGGGNAFNTTDRLIESIIYQTKPVLFTNFYLKDAGGQWVKHEYTAGNYETRYDCRLNDSPCFIWKTFDGMILGHAIGEEREYFCYYKSDMPLTSVGAISNTLSVNQAYSFKEGTTVNFNYYHNSVQINAVQVDVQACQVWKVEITDNSTGNHAVANIQSSDKIDICWEDARNNWSTNISDYSIHIS